MYFNKLIQHTPSPNKKSKDYSLGSLASLDRSAVRSLSDGFPPRSTFGGDDSLFCKSCTDCCPSPDTPFNAVLDPSAGAGVAAAAAVVAVVAVVVVVVVVLLADPAAVCLFVFVLNAF